MGEVAVVISNIGNSDEIYPLCKQSVPFELFYLTESTLPFPLPNFDNRLKGKYFKCQAHRFLDHDIIIHLDASIEVINERFVEFCIEKLQGNDIAIELHKQRESAYEELEHIIEEIKKGNRYLLKRYAKQPLYLEYAFYKREGLPKKFPLYQCSFFARWNNNAVNEMFDTWWNTTITYTNFDQCAMSHALWKFNAVVNEVEAKDLFIRNRHIDYNK